MKKIIALLVLTLFTTNINAETIILEDFNSTGIDSTTASVIQSIFQEELTANGATVLLESENDSESDKYKSSQSKLSGSIRKLGDKITITTKLMDSKDGSVIITNKLSATSLDESDVMIARLSKSIINRETVDESAEVGLIAEGENKNEVTRKESFFSSGMFIGTGVLITEDPDASMRFGTKSWYETPDFAGELTVEFDYGSDIFGMGLGLGFVKFLSKENTSPFYSFGLGYTIYAFEDDTYEYDDPDDYYYYESTGKSFGGIAPKAGFGVTFLRTYDFKFVVEGEYKLHIPMFSEEGKLNSVYHGFGLNIAILRKASKKSNCCF